MNGLEILDTGPLSLIQDLGRIGHLRSGVGVSGAADRRSLRLGNRLVGNNEGAAGVEVLLGGLSLRAQQPTTIAFTGAPAQAYRDGIPVALMEAMVAILLLSNVIGAGKVAVLDLPAIGPWEFGAWEFGAGILFFPVSYVIGDVLTEVYGYAHARRCIWAGFAALVFMALMATIVVALPPAANWGGQLAYEQVFGQVPRIVLASMIAFWAGEFVNSYVLARMKLWTQGKALWSRTIGSTVVGQGVDSALFYPIAFLGAEGWTPQLVMTVSLTQWGLKVAWEVLLTPVTYKAVGFLKAREGVDVYDSDTDFSPFARS